MEILATASAGCSSSQMQPLSRCKEGEGPRRQAGGLLAVERQYMMLLFRFLNFLSYVIECVVTSCHRQLCVPAPFLLAFPRSPFETGKAYDLR